MASKGVMAIVLCGMLAFVAVSQAAEDAVEMSLDAGVRQMPSFEPAGGDGDGEALSPDEEDQFANVQNDKDMRKAIHKEMQDYMEKEMAKDDDGEEEVAIGNTLKTMEAKSAVQAELESEISIDCEVSEWSPYGKCSAACDGGKQKRTREVQQQSQNGGAPCPKLSEEIVCNSDSCASEAYQRRATRRKLTAAEKKREGIINRRKVTLAMRSRSVQEMKKRTREVMRKLVHTELADVKLPGETEEPSPEAQIRKTLQAAMAKNSVSDAMKTYEATKHAAADQKSQSEEDDDMFKKATAKPIQPVNGQSQSGGSSYSGGE